MTSTRPLAERVLAADPGLPAFFLGRLAALLTRQVAAVDPDERRALGRAALSTFLDCVDLGLTDRACAILAEVREPVDPDDDPAA
jgi:hypothetical protein